MRTMEPIFIRTAKTLIRLGRCLFVGFVVRWLKCLSWFTVSVYGWARVPSQIGPGQEQGLLSLLQICQGAQVSLCLSRLFLHGVIQVSSFPSIRTICWCASFNSTPASILEIKSVILKFRADFHVWYKDSLAKEWMYLTITFDLDLCHGRRDTALYWCIVLLAVIWLEHK